MQPLLFSLNPLQDALFLDVDGTLLDIAPTPASVVVPEGLIAGLYALHNKLNGALALISGRSLAEVDHLLLANNLPLAGSHGAEWRLNYGGDVHHAPPLPNALREFVKKEFTGQPGILIEDKTYSIAVHYRQTPERQQEIEAMLYGAISDQTGDLIVLQGKMVFEIMRPTYNKGTAIERFMQHPPFMGRKPVFLGDDETDITAISACMKLGGLAARVGDQPHFKALFPSPTEVRAWVMEQVNQTSRSGAG